VLVAARPRQAPLPREARISPVLQALSRLRSARRDRAALVATWSRWRRWCWR
jgi:hypothetical protein